MLWLFRKQSPTSKSNLPLHVSARNDEHRTAWYATLVLSQFVHVFVCKTRFVPMFEHGVLNNSMMNYG